MSDSCTRSWMPPILARPRIHTDIALGGAAVASIATSLLVSPDLHGALGAALAVTMLAIAVIDARHFIIPDELNAVGLVLALLSAVAGDPQGAWTAVGAALLRGTVLALAFLAIRIGYRWLRGRDGIGLGDVKLAAVAGAWLDWLTMPIAIEIAAIAALAVYVVFRYVLRRPLDAATRMPFGLFLAPAIWLGWVVEGLGLVPL
jgi:leader peptidase (prepilin peptidase) / N-methyltransferase